MEPAPERRARVRVPLHWPVVIENGGEPPQRAETQNISSGGMYCLSNRAFAPGQRLEVVLTLPGCLDERGCSFRLHCTAEVLRCEQDASKPGYGFACRFTRYTLATDCRDAGPEIVARRGGAAARMVPELPLN
jgi:hypothetical protein